nr:creatininase family protein [Nocardia cyriacigeorgica]
MELVTTATSTDIARTEPRTAVMPVGSFEPQGDHLPLATDRLIATALAYPLVRSSWAGWSPPPRYVRPPRPIARAAIACGSFACLDVRIMTNWYERPASNALAGRQYANRTKSIE